MTQRRGFITTTTALALLALVGVAVGELTSAFSADAKRTENQRIESQLRQVMIAGILQSRQTTPIQLPDELRKLEMKFAIQGKTITAQMDRHRLEIELPN